jgi:hypothetical protein
MTYWKPTQRYHQGTEVPLRPRERLICPQFSIFDIFSDQFLKNKIKKKLVKRGHVLFKNVNKQLSDWLRN